MSSPSPALATSPEQNGFSDDATARARLLEVSTAILRQAVNLVQDSLTTDQQLTAQSNYIPGSTIGKHLRHARDHFALLAEAISTPAPHVLNYDKRARNTPMESQRKAAADALNEAIAQLHEVVPTANLAEPITLHAVTPYPQVMETTFARELWFAGLHAIHHWSMVRVIAGELGIKLEDTFGFAPSTIVHMESKAAFGKPKI
ncbi:uncharacterized protein TRAVEDRAFT_109602 [Trametes versicolor FP-101664 SS1]|uniref:uncharacterized protein n=1 Tax=Trametes versicolor (strain FP-101664) TaxID=717944 RepID=UPI0004621609|nr:uncharacterized protein TRAVEDRAFT_109602 [Trametes versicolor FP-101664 SS1]EIW64516.1 hypothetical protein TRAVEDRAFT_109602 [Trametes versicolor FP-101664 SS1]